MKVKRVLFPILFVIFAFSCIMVISNNYLSVIFAVIFTLIAFATWLFYTIKIKVSKEKFEKEKERLVEIMIEEKKKK